MIPLVPAFIPKSEADVRAKLEHLSFSPEIHLDVIDGKFDDDISWPYQPVGEPKSVKPYTDQFTLEVHLMVADPLGAAVDWITAGADMVLFHVESITLENFKKFAEYTHVTAGICCYGDTSIETLLQYAAYADYVQLMGIHEIGAKGQPFRESVLDDIRTVKQALPHMMVSIDGHVAADTVVQLREAGADRLVANSAITQQSDPQAAQSELMALL